VVVVSVEEYATDGLEWEARLRHTVCSYTSSTDGPRW